MTSKKDKQRRELEEFSWKSFWVGLLLGVLSGVVIIGVVLIIDGSVPYQLKEQLQSCQEKVPDGINYQYDFTRCVFKVGTEEGEKIAVCNLLMRSSCEEITYLDQNCEVLP